MANVPTYNGRQVAPSTGVSQRLTGGYTAEAFGGRTAAALGQAGNALAGAADNLAAVAVEEARRTERAKVRDALNAFRENARQLLEGNPNGITEEDKAGVFGRTGKNSLGATEFTQKRLQDLREEQGRGIESDYGRELWDSVSKQRSGAILDSVARWETGMRKQYRINSLDEELENDTQDAISFRHTPGEVDKYASSIVANAGAKAFELGLDKEQSISLVNNTTAKFYQRVLAAILAEDGPKAAEEFFNAHKAKTNEQGHVIQKGSFGADYEAAFSGYIKEQVDHDEMVEKVTRASYEILSLQEQLRWADETFEGKQRTQARSMLVSRDSEKQRANAQIIEESMNRTYGQIIADPRGAKIDPSLPVNLQIQAEQFRAKVLEGGVTQDWKAWTLLSNLAEDEPERFAQIDAWKFRTALDDSHYDKLLTMLGQAKAKRRIEVPNIHARFRERIKPIEESLNLEQKSRLRRVFEARVEAENPQDRNVENDIIDWVIKNELLWKPEGEPSKPWNVPEGENGAVWSFDEFPQGGGAWVQGIWAWDRTGRQFKRDPRRVQMEQEQKELEKLLEKALIPPSAENRKPTSPHGPLGLPY